MSEHHVEVIKIDKIIPHPNADTLSITEVHGGYPVIVKNGQYKEGDLAVYIPVDATVPLSDPRFSFLKSERIKAMRLRGIFSMGLLIPAEPGMKEGDDVANHLGIGKWEPPISTKFHKSLPGSPHFASEAIYCPVRMPIYDIEGLRRYRDILVEGEEVIVTEKIHGANARFCYAFDEFWVASRTQVKKHSELDLWWKIANKIGLKEKLQKLNELYGGTLVLYGEVYGQVQDLKYDKEDIDFAAFDLFDIVKNKYLDYDKFKELCNQADIVTVPELYRGPWDISSSKEWAEGQSTIANNVREGFVVKPIIERTNYRLGRVILKMAGEGYLTRKGA